MKRNDTQASSTNLGSVVTTADGSLTLSHPGHGECYHSQHGAMTEARLLYVESSGLGPMLRQSTSSSTQTAPSILDVGLGLGLNAIATLTAWHEAAQPPSLDLHSLEINADLVAALASGQAPWQHGWAPNQIDFCLSMRALTPHHWHADIQHPNCQAVARWRLYVGDAAVEPVPPPANEGGYHFIWQDPFSPEKNPPLWQPDWFRRVRAHAAPACVLMTYSVAGPVRRALTAGGWQWRKIPALLPGKREWLRATPNPAGP